MVGLPTTRVPVWFWTRGFVLVPWRGFSYVELRVVRENIACPEVGFQLGYWNLLRICSPERNPRHFYSVLSGGEVELFPVCMC